MSGMQGYLQADANRPVAVKQLFNKNNQSGMAEFLNEVVVVTAIKHRNLVNLKGCCVREDQRLLVYEFMDNNDLEHHLFRKITITRKIRMCSLVNLMCTDFMCSTRLLKFRSLILKVHMVNYMNSSHSNDICN